MSAIYINGEPVVQSNFPEMTLAQYNALPEAEKPEFWIRTDASYDSIPGTAVTFNNDGTTIESTDVDGAIKEVDAKRKSDLTSYNETGTTASRAYKFGDLIYIGGTLYRAMTNIASGATFTIGTNVASVVIDKLVPFKILYDGNVTFTNGQGSVAISNQLLFPFLARCVGADAPALVSLSSTGTLMLVTLPTSTGYSGTLRVIVYGVDLRQ